MLLIAAPILTALLGFSLQWVTRHKHETVAVIQVDASAAARLWPRQTTSATGRRENLVHSTSDEILLAAIDSLTRESREWIEARGEPLPWLRRHVRMRFVGKSNLVTVTLRDDSLRPSNPRAEKEVVNALSQAIRDATPDAVEMFLPAKIEDR
jgi:hypothetical protein